MIRLIKPLTLRQTKGQATRLAVARRRLAIVRDCSDAGATKAEAAKRAGLTDAGLKALLFREFGTTVWPLVDTEQVSA